MEQNEISPFGVKESADDMIIAIAEGDNLGQIKEMSPAYVNKVIWDITERYFTANKDSPLRLLFE